MLTRGVDQTVGMNFRDDLLEIARDKTVEIIESAKKFLKPGLTELEMKKHIEEIQENHGITEIWHKPQIRFGVNTTLPFGVPGEKDIRLQESDIAFLDLGPIVNGHEGDVGRTFTIGSDPDKIRCAGDVEDIWHEVRDHWRETQITGPKLYKFATERALRRGWELSTKKANGHRIADFPHAIKGRGSIQGYEEPLLSNRWILEIQILEPKGQYGAFYEDLLN